jgi:hypothetical protein
MGLNLAGSKPMIKFKVDNSGLERLFKGMPKRVLVAVGSEIRTAARTFAAVAARNTLPYGAYDEPTEAAMLTVQNQIKRTQPTIDQLGSMWQDLKAVDKGLAAAMWTAYKDRKMGTVKQIIEDLSVQGGFTHGAASYEVHKKARTGIRRSVPKNHKPTHIVTSSQGAVNTLVKKKQATIGAAKAGWAAAAKSLGGSVSAREGFPSWYNTGRHKKSTGYHNMIRTETETFIELTNTVPWIDQAFPASRRKVAASEFYPAFKRALETRKAALAEAAAKRRK